MTSSQVQKFNNKKTLSSIILILIMMSGCSFVGNQEEGPFSGQVQADLFWSTADASDFYLGNTFLARPGENITVSHDALIQGGGRVLSIQPMLLFWELPGTPKGTGTRSQPVGKSGSGGFSFHPKNTGICAIKVTGHVGQQDMLNHHTLPIGKMLGDNNSFQVILL